MTSESPDPLRVHRRLSFALVGLSLAIAPINFLVFTQSIDGSGSDAFDAFFLLAILQALLGFVAMVISIVYAVRRKRAGRPITGGVISAFAGAAASAGGVIGLVLGFLGLAVAAGGGAWGRPLRIRGRVRHPELRRGADWTRGELPDASSLDAETRAALEALWLHDAQKEHASVPAFARVSWMLAAIGAPAELLERAFTAAQDEIEHTRLCFALAAGYGGRSHSVEAMPELLLGGALDVRGSALVHLAVESLKDGCLLEDYNADVAAACRDACTEPVTRAVLDRIAVEERSHAELSWSIVEHCLGRDPVGVGVALRHARRGLGIYERPTAVSGAKLALVGRADPAKLRDHGRLPDDEWAAIYRMRLAATLERIDAMLEADRVSGAVRPAVDDTLAA